MKTIFTKALFITSIASFTSATCYSQNIGINGTGASAHASALLDVDDAGSNNKGLLIPRIPLTAINASTPVTSPATSLLVYNTATASTGTNAVSPGYYYWDGTKWVRFAFTPSGSNTDAWNITGNSGTNPTNNFTGTTDAQAFSIRTNSLEAVRITTLGSVGIGTSSPTAKLDVNSGSTIVNSTAIGINAIGTYYNNGGATDVAGISSTLIDISGTTNVPMEAAMRGYYKVRPTNAGVFNAFGGYFEVNNESTSAIRSLNDGAGIKATAINSSSSVITDKMSASLFEIKNTTSQTVTEANSILIKTPTNSGGGTFTKLTGVAIEAMNTVAGTVTNNYAIHYRHSTSPFVLNSVGNVGIGTATPLAKLEIIGISSTTPPTNINAFKGISLRGNNPNVEYNGITYTSGGGGGAGLVFSRDGGYGTYASIYTNSSSNLVTDQMTERLRVSENGNVGINTSTPSEKLEVQGSVKIVDGTQGAGKVLMSDANGKASWKEAAANTNKLTYNVTYPASVAMPATGTSMTLGSPFTITTTGIYRVLVDATIPQGMILGIDNQALSNSALYATVTNRYYAQYFVYITAGSHTLNLYNDNNVGLISGGPYWNFFLEGPIN